MEKCVPDMVKQKYYIAYLKWDKIVQKNIIKSLHFLLYESILGLNI